MRCTVIDRNIKEEVGKFGKLVMDCRVLLLYILGKAGCGLNCRVGDV